MAKTLSKTAQYKLKRAALIDHITAHLSDNTAFDNAELELLKAWSNNLSALVEREISRRSALD